jgi:hypothetical protein
MPKVSGSGLAGQGNPEKDVVELVGLLVVDMKFHKFCSELRIEIVGWVVGKSVGDIGEG